MPSPGDSSRLTAVFCPSATDCWAAGTTGMPISPFSSLDEALHWNGSTWAQAIVPQPGGTSTGATQRIAGAVLCSDLCDAWQRAGSARCGPCQRHDGPWTVTDGRGKP